MNRAAGRPPVETPRPEPAPRPQPPQQVPSTQRWLRKRTTQRASCYASSSSSAAPTSTSSSHCAATSSTLRVRAGSHTIHSMFWALYEYVVRRRRRMSTCAKFVVLVNVVAYCLLVQPRRRISRSLHTPHRASRFMEEINCFWSLAQRSIRVCSSHPMHSVLITVYY